MRFISLALVSLLLGACAQVPVSLPVRLPQGLLQTPATPQDAARISGATQQEFEQALALMRQQDWPQATALLTRLTERHPQLAGPHLNLGFCLARTGQHEAAAQALHKGLALQPQSAAGWNELGRVRRELGDYSGARDAYAQALSVQPDYVYAHRNLGILLELYLGQPAAALPHYQRCLELAPEQQAELRHWVADLKRRLGAGEGS